MYSILEQLYDAPIGFNGVPFGQDSDFVKAARVKCENLEKLEATLTDEQKKFFEAFLEADGEIEGIMKHQKFDYGFHLGALIMMEIMDGRDAMLQ